MKLSVVTTTPEVQGFVPVALLSGTFTERLERAAQLGYDGVELMVQRPAELDGADIAAQVSYCGLEIAAIASGAIAMLDRLTLLGGDPAACAAAGQRLNQLIDFAGRDPRAARHHRWVPRPAGERCLDGCAGGACPPRVCPPKRRNTRRGRGRAAGAGAAQPL